MPTFRSGELVEKVDPGVQHCGHRAGPQVDQVPGIERDRVDVAMPAKLLQPGRVSGRRYDAVTVPQQSRDKPRTHISGGACHQYSHIAHRRRLPVPTGTHIGFLGWW
jgi:hypothetical protein